MQHEEMTFEQRLVRKGPELMLRWRADKGTCSIQVADDLQQRAVVTVELQFGDGRIECVELPVIQ